MATDVYAFGVFALSACTNDTDEEATRSVNDTNPTGISSPWAISTASTFAGGEPHPCPCPDFEGRRHVLFNC